MTQEKDINYWKNNCEEDYITTPISVLRYISKLEKLVESFQQQSLYTEKQVVDLLVKMNNYPTIFEGEEDIKEWLEELKQPKRLIMTSIEKIIQDEKNTPKPNQDLINNLEAFISTGTITITASNAHVCINSDNGNYKNNIN
jgi:6-phosphogluconate dehydrogenase